MPGLQLAVWWCIVRADQTIKERRTPVHKTFYDRAVSTNKQDHSSADMGSNWWPNILHHRIVYDRSELFYCWLGWETVKCSRSACLRGDTQRKGVANFSVSFLLRNNSTSKIVKPYQHMKWWVKVFELPNIIFQWMKSSHSLSFDLLSCIFEHWTTFPQRILNNVYYNRHIKGQHTILHLAKLSTFLSLGLFIFVFP